MAKDLRCDSCGGNRIFDPSNGVLLCEHCGKTQRIYNSNTNENTNLTRKYTLSYTLEPRNNDNYQYLCSSCGTTVSFEEEEDKKRCPSCGATTLNRQNRAVYVPDGILPFAISRDQAADIFRKWIASRKFAPNDLKQMAKLGKISGIYLPTWNFSFRLVGSYNAAVTKVIELGNERFYSRHLTVSNKIEKAYTNVLISGNSRITDETLDEIEPFEAVKIKPYSSEYIYGFSGIDTNMDIHKQYEDMIYEKKQSIISRIRIDLKSRYDTIERLDTNIVPKGACFNYLYVPIWANHYTYNGKEYHCYINGQTGKATGKSPKSFWKIFSLIAGIVAGVGLFVMLFL